MSYIGMDANTGLRISGSQHLNQSVTKILTTSIGTRVRRRPFGAMAADLIDTPSNGAALLQLYAAAATALMLWEPRLRVRNLSASINADRPGALVLNIHGEADTGDRTESVSLSTNLSA